MRGNINKLIKKLIRKYKTTNPYDLASCLNVLIFEVELKNTLGMYRYINKTRTIFINSNLSDEVKRFVLAHELGHAILHTKENCFYLRYNTFIKTSTYEVEANKFAAELLIDDKEFKSNIGKGFTAGQLASYFEVPEELIEYKFKNIN